MNDLKPYSYLYKNTAEPAKLRLCFVVKVPAGKSLTGPTINTASSVITVTYAVVSDANQPRDRQEEYENELNWNGNACNVKVVVGDGSGSGGGTIAIASQDAEED